MRQKPSSRTNSSAHTSSPARPRLRQRLRRAGAELFLPRSSRVSAQADVSREGSPSFFLNLLPGTALVAITTAIYYPSLHYDFIFDDIANINQYFNIRHISPREIFMSGSRWVSRLLNLLHYQIGQFDPFSYRVGNLVIHVANGLLIYGILKLVLIRVASDTNSNTSSNSPFSKTKPKSANFQITQNHDTQNQNLANSDFFTKHAAALSWLTALLFLIHPVQTQTVSYVIQGQLEGTAMLAALSMVFCLLKLAGAETKKAGALYVGALLALAVIACGTKEIAIVIPALLLLVNWFFITGGTLKKLKSQNLKSNTLKKWLALHAVITGIMGGLYIYFLKYELFAKIFSFKFTLANNIGNVITQQPKQLITPYQFFISQFKVIVHYLWIFLWPYNMSVEYDWKLAPGFFSAEVLCPLFVLLVLAYGVFKLLRRNPTHPIAFAALWFMICIAPRSSFVPSAELLVDYKTYMASFGVLFILAAACVKFFELSSHYCSSYFFKQDFFKREANAAPGAAGGNTVPVFKHGATLALILVLGISTRQRNTVWRSGLEFWGHMIANAPGKARAYNNYGVELYQNLGQWAESIPYFKKAIELDKFYPDPLNNVAIVYYNLGQVDEALAYAYTCLRLYPYYPEGYHNIGSFFTAKKDYVRAELAFKQAIALRPHYGKAYFNLGLLYFQLEALEQGFECFKKCCLEGDLDNEMGFSGYAEASMRVGKYEEAIFACKKVLQYNPKAPHGVFNLANAYFCAKQFEQARELYEALHRADPKHEQVCYNLAETYFSLELTSKALKTFKYLLSVSKNLHPHVHIRLAACQEKLGNPQLARATLTQLLAQTTDKGLQQAVKGMVAQLTEHYKLT